MMSPVWRAKLCGSIGNGNDPSLHLRLETEDKPTFGSLLALAAGARLSLSGGLPELLDLARAADRHQTDLVQTVIEDRLLALLAVENCGLVLAQVGGSGLARLEAAGRALALTHFDDFAETAGFLALDEDALLALLEDDGLTTDREDNVLAALARWLRTGAARDGGRPCVPVGALARGARPSLQTRTVTRRWWWWWWW